MAILHEAYVRGRARERARAEGTSVERSLGSVARRPSAHYDIFLSQTIRDAEIVLGAYEVLTGIGYTVYCDWIESPGTDRAAVTPANAALIRGTMGVSDSLLFLDTENSVQSLWMCWELGWFDGGRGPVAILPVLPAPRGFYRGREFLGLYPYVELGDDGQLRVVRPVVPGPSGISLIEAPNDRSFDSWRRDRHDFMRPWVVLG